MKKYNKNWKRKPRPEWKDFRNEDLFLCHKCNDWFPWFLYCIGKNIALNNYEDNTYKYMNNDKDRGGRIWACNYCINKILYNNNMIIIDEKY